MIHVKLFTFKNFLFPSSFDFIQTNHAAHTPTHTSRGSRHNDCIDHASAMKQNNNYATEPLTIDPSGCFYYLYDVANIDLTSDTKFAAFNQPFRRQKLHPVRVRSASNEKTTENGSSPESTSLQYGTHSWRMCYK